MESPINLKHIINYLSRLSPIALQKSTDGKKHNGGKNVTSRYSYKHEVLSLQSLYCRRIHPRSVTKELLHIWTSYRRRSWRWQQII